ncbi:hypothetical protein [endosymbiont of Lamellibrachia barhami]|uniref:hypothetical protein n=1 Tax=endosymbiont of Lamellibrachia barhami TaxID=205975 RepID=UPI0015AB5C66|nr:hypothetical protein [endosymbiont of Lamellibrachia barhami]
MIIKTKCLFLTLLTSILLVGCSAHPGSGIWLPAEGSESPYSRIEVLFEGRAELFVAGREAHLFRCFWSGTTADSIHMDCISADDETQKPVFTLQVSADGTARLSEAGKKLGLFQRTEQIPTRKE